ncbi:hypothetical protein [Enterobacter sp. Bisph1]|uniref:hypothetical protein n=1 Tax=Enterobacter sp. Bisph1 TaxID=1274399 RepID=UPI00057BF7E9|nr:hypothetical protein [Enterobacter sp. Bisph1]
MHLINKLTVISSFIIATTVSFAVSSAPLIGISSMYDIILPGSQSISKRIHNTGDSTAFVRVEILEIDPSKNKQQEEVPQKELSGSKLERNRLLVTPQRLIISPAGFSVVRVFWPGERERERYFRVRFAPVLPEADDSFGLDKEAISQYRKETLHAGLNVLTGYGTIVIVQPDNPTFKTVINDKAAEAVTISNDGNATIALDDLRQCKGVRTDCSIATREIILPGRTHVVKRNAGNKISFTLIEGNNKRVLNY